MIKNRFHRYYCSFCDHIIDINKEHRILNFNSKLIRVCMKCKSRVHKVLKNKYKHCDIGCSVCLKKTKMDYCTPCKLCNHFVHGKCSDLKYDEIRKLELQSSDYEWYCPPCVRSILPVNLADYSDDEDIIVNYDSKTQCFACKRKLPHKRVTYPNRYVLYNEEHIQFCEPCSTNHSYEALDNYKTLLEFTDCASCSKEVKYESVFCSICLHWTHAYCAHLTPNEIKSISTPEYGDWRCGACI